MRMPNGKKLELQREELDLLAWNIANEVINGFRVENFSERIGISREDFKHVALRLRSLANTETASPSAPMASAFRNALAITLEELGEDEFQTRTGYDFDEGKALLKKLENFLNGGDHT